MYINTLNDLLFKKLNRFRLDLMFFLFLSFICSEQFECENELESLYKTMCIDLTPRNQTILAIKKMLCEYETMGRQFQHESENNPDLFLKSLSETYFDIWTNIYHGIDRKCRETVEKEQFDRNLEKISLVIEAVNLTTLSLTDIQKINNELSMRIKNSTITLKSQLIKSLEEEKKIINKVQEAILTVSSTVDEISKIKGTVMNFGVYIFGIILGIILSLVIPLMSRISIFLSLIWFVGTSYLPSNKVTDFIFHQRTYGIVYVISIILLLLSSFKETYHIWNEKPKRLYKRSFY